MSEIDITVRTSRPVEDVKRAIETEIDARLPGGRIKRFWEGDDFRLVGMGADARIAVRAGELRASGTLRPPVSLMRGRVEEGLRETMALAAGGTAGDGSPGDTPVAPPLGSVVPESLGAAPYEAISALRRSVSGVVLDGATVPDEYLSNFGNLTRWRPRYVVKPASDEDVLATLSFARSHGLSVSTRGAAHSQSELAISCEGILLDMKSMGRVLEIDPDAMTVTCEGGAMWRDLLAKTYHHGLVPPVLTNNVSVSVAGTISVAGVGVASFLHGCQGDIVEWMDVATAGGRVARCSREENRDLFDAVRAGLGQFGIILRAALRLRRPGPMTRTYDLLYDDVGRFMEDAQVVMDAGRFQHIESWASPCAQGLKWIGGRRRPFAQWFFPFHLTVEHEVDDPPDDRAMLAGLRPYKNLLTDDLETHEFLNRLAPVFEIWKLLGTWNHPHPWMETILPWDRAEEFLAALLPDLAPGVNVGGHVLLWPARRSVSDVPLFMTPDTENLIGFGILPAVPPSLWPEARARLEAASDLSMAFGGKRYLSGYVRFTKAQWREHFGEKWPELCRLKRRFDPDGLLNPGFVPFD